MTMEWNDITAPLGQNIESQTGRRRWRSDRGYVITLSERQGAQIYYSESPGGDALGQSFKLIAAMENCEYHYKVHSKNDAVKQHRRDQLDKLKKENGLE